MHFAKKMFEDWPQNVLRPISVNVLTAFILFFLAIIFKPFIMDFFQTPSIQEYSLLCTAEPYNTESINQMHIDLFIVNKSGVKKTHQNLVNDLKILNNEKNCILSPDILLEVGNEGNLSVESDTYFNQGKGELITRYDQNKRELKVVIDHIEPRAILKAVIKVNNLRYVSPNIHRGTKAEVIRIFKNFEKYQDKCYSYKRSL